MKRYLSFLASASLVVLAASCVQTTPASRIANSPGAFERLSSSEKELVQRGQIDVGMDREAVTLALGDPSNRVEVFTEGKRSERWDYGSSQPIVTNSFGFGSGFGHGGFGRGGFGRRGFGRGGFGGHRGGGFSSFGTSVTYVPVRNASVLFFNGKVTEFVRIK